MPDLTKQVTFIILAVMLCIPALAAAQQHERKPCPCKYHSARAFASGVCSRTEDGHYCTLNYRTPQPGTAEYQQLKRLIRIVGVSIEPEVAFRAFENPEQAQNTTFYDQVLPVVLASSMEPRFHEALIAVTDALRKNVDAVMGAFSKPAGTDFRRINLEPFDGLVSYGCLEVSDGSFSTMVKASWASARFYCDFTESPGQ